MHPHYGLEHPKPTRKILGKASKKLSCIEFGFIAIPSNTAERIASNIGTHRSVVSSSVYYSHLPATIAERSRIDRHLVWRKWSTSRQHIVDDNKALSSLTQGLE